MALLVAASPCALAIGTPSAVQTGIAQAARNGVLVKGGVHLEKLGAVAAIAMDKTGTLTLGRPEVVEVVASAGVTAEELLAVAGAVEQSSQHPLAEAVVRKAEAQEIELREAGDLESLTGRGVRSSLDARRVEIGNLRLWDEADVLPEDKVRTVEELLARYDTVAMVGDGVNDAPALAAATVGIAMGGAGTAAALETADVALMGDDLAGIPFVVGLSQKTRGVIRQNLAISLAVIVSLVGATTTGFFGIGAAVAVHEGSTLLVVANAPRILRHGAQAR
jgi:cation transport ATPase